MSKVTRATSSRTLSKQTTSSQVSDIDSFVRTDKALAKFGLGLNNLSEKMAEIKNLREKTQSQVDASAQIRDIKQRSLEDQDPNNMQLYLDELDGVPSNFQDTIGDPDTKFQFNGQLAIDVDSNKIGVKKDFFNKNVKNTKASIDSRQLDFREQFINADPKRYADILKQSADLYKEGVEKNVYFPEEAEFLLKKQEATWREEAAKAWMTKDPVMAKEMIEKKFFGITDKSVRDQLILDANALIKKQIAQNKLMFDKKQDIVESEVLINIMSTDEQLKEQGVGRIGIVQLDRLRALDETGTPGGVSKDAHKAFSDLIKSKEFVTAQTEAETFEDLEFQFNALGLTDPTMTTKNVSYEKLKKFRLDVARAMAKGTIDDEDGQNWLEMTSKSLNNELTTLMQTKMYLGKVIGDSERFWGAKRLPEELRAEAFLFVRREMTKRLKDKNLKTRLNTQDEIKEFALDLFRSFTTRRHPESLELIVGQTVNLVSGSYKITGFNDEGEAELEPIEE